MTTNHHRVIWNHGAVIDDVVTTDVIKVVHVSDAARRHRQRRRRRRASTAADEGAIHGGITPLRAIVVDDDVHEEREDETMTNIIFTAFEIDIPCISTATYGVKCRPIFITVLSTDNITRIYYFHPLLFVNAVQRNQTLI